MACAQRGDGLDPGQAVDLLTDADLREETVAHNFRLAQQHYSMPALRRYLSELMAG